MDQDVIYIGDDERNADRRTGTRPAWSPRPRSPRTVVVPAGASRPMVIQSGGSAPAYPAYGYPQQPLIVAQPPSFAARFGMTTGELIDTGIQILAAITPLPAAPVAQGEAGVDVENLVTYQTALATHAKRDEQLRTLGNLLVRILK